MHITFLNHSLVFRHGIFELARFDGEDCSIVFTFYLF